MGETHFQIINKSRQGSTSCCLVAFLFFEQEGKHGGNKVNGTRIKSDQDGFMVKSSDMRHSFDFKPLGSLIFLCGKTAFQCINSVHCLSES
jgi:hypothetical protein